MNKHTQLIDLIVGLKSTRVGSCLSREARKELAKDIMKHIQTNYDRNGEFVIDDRFKLKRIKLSTGKIIHEVTSYE